VYNQGGLANPIRRGGNQILPVAVKAISKDIPLTNVQFSTLQSAFLFAYAFMYAGGQDFPDATLPRELQDANPLGIWRLVDKRFSKDPV